MLRLPALRLLCGERHRAGSGLMCELIYEGEEILEGNIAAEAVGGADDEAAAGSDLAEEASDFGADAVGGLVREEMLDADAAQEGDVSSVLALKLVDVHDVGLDGVEAGEPDLDQVGEDGADVAVGVEEGGLAVGGGRLHHAGEAGLDELAPEVGAHDETVLGAPVIAEADHVEGVPAGAGDEGEVEVTDAIEQLMGEGGVLDHVEEKGLHAAQAPGALEEAEADAPHEVEVGLGGGVGVEGVEEAGEVGGREGVALEGGLPEEGCADHADFAGDGLLPDDAEGVCVVGFVEALAGFRIADADAAEVRQEIPVEVGIAGEGDEAVSEVVPESEVIGADVGFLVGEGPGDAFAGVIVGVTAGTSILVLGSLAAPGASLRRRGSYPFGAGRDRTRLQYMLYGAFDNAMISTEAIDKRSFVVYYD